MLDTSQFETGAESRPHTNEIVGHQNILAPRDPCKLGLSRDPVEHRGASSILRCAWRGTIYQPRLLEWTNTSVVVTIRDYPK